MYESFNEMIKTLKAYFSDLHSTAVSHKFNHLLLLAFTGKIQY